MPSTAIRSYSYDAERRELTVRFRPSGDYVYLDVPPAEYEALNAAPSKGTHVNTAIKPRYRFRRGGAAPRRIRLDA